MPSAPKQSLSSLKALIDTCSYPGLVFQFSPGIDDSDIAHPQVRVHCPEGTCNETGKTMPWNGRWWRLSQHMTDTEVVATCFLAVIQAQEHETREKFKFEGVSVFDSHVDVYALKAAREGGWLDTREDPRT